MKLTKIRGRSLLRCDNVLGTGAVGTGVLPATTPPISNRTLDIGGRLGVVTPKANPDPTGIQADAPGADDVEGLDSDQEQPSKPEPRKLGKIAGPITEPKYPKYDGTLNFLGTLQARLRAQRLIDSRQRNHVFETMDPAEKIRRKLWKRTKPVVPSPELRAKIGKLPDTECIVSDDVIFDNPDCEHGDITNLAFANMLPQDSLTIDLRPQFNPDDTDTIDDDFGFDDMPNFDNKPNDEYDVISGDLPDEDKPDELDPEAMAYLQDLFQ